jgi:hypothetical protein
MAGELIGQSLKRFEDFALLTGRGRYAADLPVAAGTLHAAVLRSPHAHAEVLGPGVEPVGFRAAMLPRYRDTRGMDHVSLDATRRKPARSRRGRLLRSFNGYDGPEILPISTCPFCLIGADAEQTLSILVLRSATPRIYLRGR